MFTIIIYEIYVLMLNFGHSLTSLLIFQNYYELLIYHIIFQNLASLVETNFSAYQFSDSHKANLIFYCFLLHEELIFQNFVIVLNFAFYFKILY
jgi:hypothetical protein